MSDGGFLPMARELRREVGVPLRLAAELAAWRAGRTYFDETQAMILFGIGLDTIQRIERGKVEPEPDIAERIARVIHNIHPHSPASPSAADVSPATPTAGSEGGAAHSPLVSAAPLLSPESAGLVPRPSFWLAKADKTSKSAGAFHVEMLLDGTVYQLPIDAAEG
jgi:DNA-binding XRE family transcriptional regulator